MAEELKTERINAEPKIVVDYRSGRWGKVFHLFDFDGREITLYQKDAVRMARNVLRIATGKVKNG